VSNVIPASSICVVTTETVSLSSTHTLNIQSCEHLNYQFNCHGVLVSLWVPQRGFSSFFRMLTSRAQGICVG